MKKQPIIDEGFNPHAIIRHLKHGDLLIHTIPDEEWRLSCYRHKELLVDVFTLAGRVRGSRRAQFYQCGRLCEILLKLLWYGRKVQYLSFNPHTEDEKVSTFTRTHTRLADTFEEDTLIRLRGGDLFFKAIPGEIWRLTNSYFGQSTWEAFNVFHMAEEKTLGTPGVRLFKSTSLEYVLLEWLYQQSMWVEHTAQEKVLEFPQR